MLGVAQGAGGCRCSLEPHLGSVKLAVSARLSRSVPSISCGVLKFQKCLRVGSLQGLCCQSPAWAGQLPSSLLPLSTGICWLLHLETGLGAFSVFMLTFPARL